MIPEKMPKFKIFVTLFPGGVACEECGRRCKRYKIGPDGRPRGLRCHSKALHRWLTTETDIWEIEPEIGDLSEYASSRKAKVIAAGEKAIAELFPAQPEGQVAA